MKLSVLFGTAVSVAAMGLAQAATLDGVQGNVQVNSGDGYVSIRGGAELQPGDKVMVDAKGKARLVYADGCNVHVKAGTVAVVDAKSPCSQFKAQAAGDTVVIGGQTYTWVWVAGGLVLVAGAVTGIVVGTSSNNNNNNGNNSALLALLLKPKCASGC